MILSNDFNTSNKFVVLPLDTDFNLSLDKFIIKKSFESLQTLLLDA